MHFIIAGGGGASLRPVEMGPRSLFAHSGYGFAELEVEPAALTIRFVGADLQRLYGYTLRK